MSTSKNDITGDLIQSKVSDQKKYILPQMD